MPLQRLEKAHVDALVTSLVAGGLKLSNGRPRRKWSPRSLNLMLTVLQMVLEDAMRQGWVVRNVAHLVDRVPHTKREMQTFTERDVRKLPKAAESDRLEAAWHLALSGLRRGEVCGLTWDDIDLSAGLLIIQRTRVRVDGVVQESTPKTAKGNRVLPLPDSLTRVLKRARKRQNEDRLLRASTTSSAATWSPMRAAHRCTLRLWASPGCGFSTARGCVICACMMLVTLAGLSCIYEAFRSAHCRLARSHGRGLHDADLRSQPGRRAALGGPRARRSDI